jgi:hypothetical protein
MCVVCACLLLVLYRLPTIHDSRGTARTANSVFCAYNITQARFHTKKHARVMHDFRFKGANLFRTNFSGLGHDGPPAQVPVTGRHQPSR